MESPALNPAPARSHRGRTMRATMPIGAITLLALGSALLLPGCGGPQDRVPPPTSLVTGRRAAPPPSAQLASATAVARAFAQAYAPTVYLRRPPRPPHVTSVVRQALILAAARVPASRRSLQPHSAGLELSVLGRGRVSAELRIADGRSPAFSIGFTLAVTAAGWTVVSVSTPG